MTDTTLNYTAHDALPPGYTVRLELHGVGHGIVKNTMVREVEANATKGGA